MTTVYVISSLRSTEVPFIAKVLRNKGFSVIDDWWSASEDADQWWTDHEKLRGRAYIDALAGYHAEAVFNMDKRLLDMADIGVLLLPAGKSAHLELGYMLGQGKPGFIVMDKEPEHFDVMYRFASVVNSVEELLLKLEGAECLYQQ